MRQLNAFTFTTLDGYYKDPENDIQWHQHGPEEAEFSAASMAAGDTLLFGRVTFEMMEAFWPTPQAFENFPAVAEGMARAEKIVFSRAARQTNWENARYASEDLIDFVRRLKQTPGANLTLLGSGTILTQLADHGLIDTYQIMIDPVAIGDGRPIFAGLKQRLDLKLLDSRRFQSGVVLLTYEPGARG